MNDNRNIRGETSFSIIIMISMRKHHKNDGTSGYIYLNFEKTHCTTKENVLTDDVRRIRLYLQTEKKFSHDRLSLKKKKASKLESMLTFKILKWFTLFELI